MHLFYIYETDHEATHVVALLHCPCRPCAPTIRKLYATESNTWLTLHGPMDAILAKGFDIWDAYFFKKNIFGMPVSVDGCDFANIIERERI